MPLIEYQCKNPICNKTKEVLILPGDKEELIDCDYCGTRMKQILSSYSFELKGKDWYNKGWNGRKKEIK